MLKTYKNSVEEDDQPTINTQNTDTFQNLNRATSDVTLLHAVAADVRLHQRMLRPQVAYSEHEVVCSIDAS